MAIRNYPIISCAIDLFKKLSVINGLWLIALVSLGGLFFIASTAGNQAQAGDHSTMCAQPADVVLIMDRSGSMDYTSRCDWWQLKCLNPPSCSSGYNWVENTTYNQNQSWCNSKNQSAPHQSAYLAINPKKIAAAKEAANNFVGLMGPGDQSALVSYANSATLDKLLSNNHPATQTAINSLAANGATDIGDAIKLGTNELLSIRANPQAVRAMVLLTDGLANKPNGPGYGEYPADVAYALAKAAEAAAAGIKIFTIGLGTNGEINQTMLQNIATTTGGQYYNAPTQNDLQAIYSTIATRLCRFGSISGCKYSDANKDGLIIGEEKIAGWEIVLENNDTVSQLTDLDGCFKFAGLLPGGYALSEQGKTGVIFEQTYPASGSYAINLAEGENLENYNFGNYLPVCGNQILDISYGEVCEIGSSQACSAASGYAGVKSCLSDCSGWSECVPTEYCGDGIVNDNEPCDGQAGVGPHQTCSQACTLINLTYCGDGFKQSPNNSLSGGPSNDGYEDCDGSDGVGPNQVCEANCVLTNLIYCGDGLKNGHEQCDDGNTNNDDGCKNNCRLPGCQADVDVMMVLDRSGSMGYTSICDWWQLKCLNPPSCSFGYNWVKNTTYNQTQAWCAAKNQSAPHQSVYQAINPVKIIAAKEAANNFLNLMSEYDQSGLVSYANSASLDQLLSNNHAATQTAVNSLAASGATDIGDAIKLGSEELLSIRANPEANKVMILLTDGLANKPNGPGYGEYAADVTYAENQAALAAAVSVKIFTIGLGNPGEINETMLQSIASMSNGLYYHAPTGAQLQEIFDQIVDDSCPDAVCGNSQIEPGETCDDGTNNGQYGYCKSDCAGSTPAVCGNGALEGDEQCDDGNMADGDGCSSQCATEAPQPICGNGVKEGAEECDGADGVGQNQTCSQACTLTDLPFCGDSIINGAEICDDGNQLNQDGCDSTCQIEPAASCLKINEVYYDVDDNHGDTEDNEWLELYNACAFAVNLMDWTIKDNNSTTTISQALNLASHSFVVLARASTTWAFWNVPAETEKIELGGNLGNGLGNNGDQLILKDNNGVMADQMSYGDNTTVFSLPEPPPTTTEGRSIARTVNGLDTDTAADWAYLVNPSPGN